MDFKKLELILEEIELFDSKNSMLYDVYMDRNNKFYARNKETNEVLIYEYIKPYDEIIKEHREQILNYRLFKVTKDDEVCPADIFMHGGYVSLVNQHLKTVKECIENGMHLLSCDTDGFCNECGYQESLDDF